MNITVFICNLSKDKQKAVENIITESIIDMCLSHEESEKAFNNAMCGRICDLSELIRYDEILLTLGINDNIINVATRFLFDAIKSSDYYMKCDGVYDELRGCIIDDYTVISTFFDFVPYETYEIISENSQLIVNRVYELTKEWGEFER